MLELKPTRQITELRYMILLNNAAILNQITGLIDLGVKGKELGDAVEDIIKESRK